MEFGFGSNKVRTEFIKRFYLSILCQFGLFHGYFYPNPGNSKGGIMHWQSKYFVYKLILINEVSKDLQQWRGYLFDRSCFNPTRKEECFELSNGLPNFDAVFI